MTVFCNRLSGLRMKLHYETVNFTVYVLLYNETVLHVYTNTSPLSLFISVTDPTIEHVPILTYRSTSVLTASILCFAMSFS